jgi:hypothetical protein
MKNSADRFSEFTEWLTRTKIWFLFASFAILLPLIVYAYMGIFSRYQADDFCLAWNGTNRSFLNAQTTWYKTDSSRFAATMIFTLSDKLGRWTVPALPAVVLILWLVASFWLIHLLQMMLKLKIPRLVSFFLAELLVYFTLLLVPNLHQVLYWRSGMVVYLLPIVTLTCLLIFLLVQATRPGNKLRTYLALLAVLLFFFNAGFSETMATIQVGLMALIIVAVIIHKKMNDRKWVLVLSACALLGSLLAMAVLYFSPATRMRQGLVGAAPDLINLVRMSLSNAFVYLYITLADKAFPILVLFSTTLLVGYLVFATQPQDVKINPVSLVSALLLTPIITYLLVVFVCAPFAYGESAYPEARVLVNAAVLLTMMVIVEGSILGVSLGLLQQLSQERLPVGVHLVTLLLLVIMSLFPLYSIRKVVSEIPGYQARALAWDDRDALIRRLAAQGEQDISVTALDGFAGILEISPTPSNWVNGCAALYYGVHSITATAP